MRFAGGAKTPDRIAIRGDWVSQSEWNYTEVLYERRVSKKIQMGQKGQEKN